MKPWLFALITATVPFGSIFGQSPRILWGFDTQSFCAGMAAADDLDGDGNLEIVFGCYRNDGGIYALNAEDGSLLWSYFPHNPPHQGCNDTAPLIYDVDGDGMPDVVVACSCTPKTICLDGKTGALKWEAPSRGSDSPPTIADLDGDGRMEILHGEFLGWVRCLDAETGAFRWDMQVHTNSWIQTAPTIADLDNDGQLDFVVGSWAFDKTDSLYAFHGLTKERLWALPVHDYMYHGTAAADLDRDGIPELLIGSYNDTLYCINGKDGAVKWTWAAASAVAAPAVVADMDGDGRCEIVLTSWIQTTVLNDQGQLVWQQYNPGFNSSFRGPVVSDINGDSFLDVVLGTYGGRLIVFDGKDGATLYDVDLAAHYGNSVFQINHAAIISDFDKDGTLDAFVVGGYGEYPAIEKGYGRAYAVSLGPGNGPDWLMFQGDPRRTSSLCSDPATGIDKSTESLSRVNIYPNPNAGSFMIEGDYDYATLVVFNLLGEIVLKKELQGSSTEVHLTTPGNYVVQVFFRGIWDVQKVVVRP
jgi:outer membrane protein assembly factor BamB